MPVIGGTVKIEMGRTGTQKSADRLSSTQSPITECIHVNVRSEFDRLKTVVMCWARACTGVKSCNTTLSGKEKT